MVTVAGKPGDDIAKGTEKKYLNTGPDLNSLYLFTIKIYFYKMEKYLVVIEKAENNYSAFSPDVLDCIATGVSVEEATVNMKEALQFHLENCDDIPQPKGISRHIADGIFKDGEVADEYFSRDFELNILCVRPRHVSDLNLK